MHIRLVAVGDRQPAWVGTAFGEYSARFPKAWRFRTDILSTARRSRGDRTTRGRDEESRAILAKIANDERLVLLDEHGSQSTSTELAQQLNDWQHDGRHLCFVIGGPDGVSPECRSRADHIWSLSKLTLPHGLARVLFAEQLYRASTLLAGHPYHRE